MTENILQNIYTKNTTFLHQNFPDFFNSIKTADSSKTELNITDLGINISLNKHMIYPKNVNKSIDLQVQNFLQKPSAISLNPYKYTHQEKENIHANILQRLENISPYNFQHQENYTQNPNLTSFPFMIMSGIGSGVHIEKLLEKTDIKHLIIIDSDYSLLNASMYIVDWEKIIRFYNQPNYSINFFVGEEAFKIAYSLINFINIVSPYKGYFIPWYTHYSSPFFEEVKKHFLDKIQLNFQGLGFIDDELNSLRKTLLNLDHNIPVYTGCSNIPNKSTLFIVASGPSIDKDIEYIKKHKDDVVIFSCGTALRILEKNGITPDFHFEIEREEEVHDVLQQYTSEHIRKDVALIGLNVLYDKVFTEDFEESYLYFRESDSGSSIVPNNIPKLFNTNPTVTNGAVSFASEFSWDRIYLFGADMGFKDKNNHHSKDAFHYTEENKEIDWHTQSGNDITNIVPSNFGEEQVYSTSVFFWTKQKIENALVHKKDLIYNCSDGAKIEHTHPFHAKNIVIPQSNKQEVIKAIKSNFKDLKTNQPEFRKNYTKQVDTFYYMIDLIKQEISNKQITSFGDIFTILDKSFDIFRQIETQNGADYKSRKFMGTSILRGTLASCYSIIYTHTLATHDLNKALTFAKNSFEIIAPYLENIKKEITKG